MRTEFPSVGAPLVVVAAPLIKTTMISLELLVVRPLLVETEVVAEVPYTGVPSIASVI